MLKNKKLKLISFFVFFLGAASIFGTTFLSSTAHAAAPPLLVNDQVYKNLSAHQHYWWLYGCFATADIDKTTQTEVDGWDFFEGSTEIIMLGSMYGGGDPYLGDRDCSNQSIVKTAFNYLGFTNSRDTFCSITGKQFGGNDVDKTTCLAGSGGGDWDNSASKGVRTNWFQANAESKKPTLRSEGKYLRAYSSLMKGCDVKFVNDTLYDKSTDVPGVNDDNKYAVAVVVKTGGTNDKPTLAVKYIQGVGINSSGSEIGLVTNSGGGTTFQTCNQLAEEARNNAAAYAAALESLGIDSTQTPNATGSTDEDGEGKTTCTIDNIGWIICPVMNFMAGIVDAAYEWIASLLAVQPVVTTGTGEPLYQAWQLMRNFANVMFVLGFLIIIYSQITGMGVSNYGIKKLLPKLIMAAILVNVSYWLCAIAVDISNIAGTSINSLFEGLKGTIASPNLNDGAFADNTGTGWAGITGLVLAGTVTGGALALLGISILLPALIAALVAIVTVFLVLTLRQALIILLIVISPLAFVALLLPNTEEWFKKWRSLFQTLLVMFPIISVIFGASAFASEIVMKSSTTFAVQIMGALITILPLAITPIVMKTAGGVLNRFAGYINNPNKGPFDRMRKGAEGYRKDRQNVRNLRALRGDKTAFGRRGIVQYGARKKAIQSGREQELSQATTNYTATKMGESEAFRNAAAGGTALNDANALAKTRVQAAAKAALSKETLQNIDNIQNTMDYELASSPQLLAAKFKEAGTMDERVAYARQMARNGSPGVGELRSSLTEYSAAVDPSNKAQTDEELTLKEFLANDDSMKKAGRDFEVWSQNEQKGKTFEQVSNDIGVWKDISAQRFASMSPSSQGHALKLLEEKDQAGLQALVGRIVADTTAMGNIKGTPQETIKRILSQQASSPPPPPNAGGSDDNRGYL